MRKASYSLLILLLILIMVITASGALPLQAQSTPGTAAATESQGGCSSQTWIKQIAFSPDGKYIVANWQLGVARLWEAATGVMIHEFFVANYDPLGPVAFSPDGRYLLTAGSTDLAIIWDISTGKEIQRFTADWTTFGGIRSGIFSSDSKFLLVGVDVGARLWDVQTGKLVHDFRNDTSEHLRHAQFSPDRKRVFTDGGKITIWDVQEGKVLFTYNDPWGNLSPDGNYFVTYGSDTNKMLLWDAQDLVQLATVTGEFGEFSDDGKYLWTYSDKELALWDAKSGKKLQSFAKGWRGYFFHNMDYLLVFEYAEDNKMAFRIWDVKGAEELWRISVDDVPGYTLVISPDNQLVASGTAFGELRLRDVHTGTIVRQFC